MEFSGINISIIDIIALSVFLILWQGYAWLVDVCSYKNTTNLINIVHSYRYQWVSNLIVREDRLIDIRIIANLLKTTTFFASTSLFLVAGLFGILGYGDHAMKILSKLPFFTETGVHMWVVKTLMLIVIFIFSFFKFTWVARQFNYASVLIVAAPHSKTISEKEEVWVSQISTILSNAARHFNASIRSYYFGLVALSWYISPILLIILSFSVVWIIYRREFRSKTLDLLANK